MDIQTAFSPCRKWRYVLVRQLQRQMFTPKGGYRTIVCVGLNPSTADESKDDPTIRRLKTFAAANGCSRLVMLNLFAFRATDPHLMMDQMHQAIGSDNDFWLRWYSLRCKESDWPLIAAWGDHGQCLRRQWHVDDMLSQPPWLCLGTTKSGAPRHPLYVRTGTPLIPYRLPPKPATIQ